MTYGIPESEVDRAAIVERWRIRDYRQGSDYADNAVDLALIRDSYVAELGKRAGMAAFRALRRVDLGLGSAVASKMLTVADHIGDFGRALPATYQYVLARAVKLGKGTASDLIAEAESMPMLDFCELHHLVKPRAGKTEAEPVECPLGLTCPHPKEEK